MIDWNVVISLRENGYREARRRLRRFGDVQRTGFYNVLALRVDDTRAFLEALARALDADPALRECIARAVPAAHTFTYQSPEEFDARAREAVAPFAAALAGRRFYVRMHRRGFRHKLSSQEEERRLDHFLLESLQRAGTPGKIDFEDPEAVVTIETVGPRAGVALWRRDDLERYPFLHVD